LAAPNSTLTGTSKIIKLQVQETYYSDDLRFIEMFGSNSVSDTSEFLIDSNISHIALEKSSMSPSMSLKQQFNQTVSEQKTVVMTIGSDPYVWSAYGYAHPAHLWKLNDDETAYVQADPINLVWIDENMDNVHEQILDVYPSWTGISILIAEYDYTLWDAANQTHITSESVASSITRGTGGYHARLYSFQGNVYGAAHQDSSVHKTIPTLIYTGHQIVNFESVESMIADCFDNNNWDVDSNGLHLLNGSYYAQEYGYQSVYNNGDATVITPA
jgi:hypothetical protein